MVKLLSLILAATAMIANALVITPNVTSTSSLSHLKRTAFTRPYSHPIPSTDDGNPNTYTVQRMDQFREGHVDAMYICSVVIEQATRNSARFDRIFGEFFQPADRELVLNVFKAMWDYSGAKQGNPEFSKIRIIDDRPMDESEGFDPSTMEPKHCIRKVIAATLPPTELENEPDQPSQTIFCPQFFRSGTINGGPGREWPKVPVRTCSRTLTRVSKLMWTMGHHLIHEYTHLIEIVGPVLGDTTEDHAYHFFACRNYDKALATKNADSYANFATELMWSTLCDRDYDPPLSDNKHESPEGGSGSQVRPSSAGGSSRARERRGLHDSSHSRAPERKAG